MAFVDTVKDAALHFLICDLKFKYEYGSIQKKGIFVKIISCTLEIQVYEIWSVVLASQVLP